MSSINGESKPNGSASAQNVKLSRKEDRVSGGRSDAMDNALHGEKKSKHSNIFGGKLFSKKRRHEMTDLEAKNKCTVRRTYWLAFFLPSLLYLLAYAIKGIFPFGSGDILSIDLYHQYAPFLAELRRKFWSFDSLTFSWHAGLGISFYPLWTYYLASPINIIAIIFPAAFLTEAVFAIILVKIGLMGVTAHHLLRKGFGSKGYLSVFFAGFYAVSNFVMAYAWNIMWLDSLVLLPLVLLGIIYHFRDGKRGLFIASAACCLIFNYYSAYFVAAFSVLFAVVAAIQFGKPAFREKLIAFGKLIVSACVAVAIAAFVVYPTIKALQITSATGDAFPPLNQFGGNITDYFAQFEILREPNVMSGLPNIFAGILTVFLLPAFFISRTRKNSVKWAYGTLFFFMLLSFYYKPLDFMWHGMHYPNSLDYRYAFVFVLFLIIMAYQAYEDVHKLRFTPLLFIAMVFTVIVALRQKLVDGSADNMRHFRLLATFVILVAYVMLLSRQDEKSENKHLRRGVMAFMALELAVNCIGGIYMVTNRYPLADRNSYVVGEKAGAVRELLEIAKKDSNGKFARLEVRNETTTNDGMLFGFPAFSVFASTFQKGPVPGFRDLGYDINGVNSFSYDDSTHFIDSILGIKYLIVPEDAKFSDTRRKEIAKSGKFTLYKFDEALPFGFFVDGNSRYKDYNSWVMTNSPFQNQNILGSEALGAEYWLMTDQPFVPANTGEGLPLTTVNDADGKPTNEFTFNREGVAETWCFVKAVAPEKGEYYVAWDGINNVVGDVNGYIHNFEKFYSKGGNTGIIDLGLLEAGEEVQFRAHIKQEFTSGSFRATLGKLNEEAYTKSLQKYVNNAFEVETIKDGHIKGKITAPADGFVFLPTLHHPGWHFYVDGHKVEPIVLRNSFIMLPVSGGKHEITGNFEVPGLKAGVLISLFTLLALLGYWFFNRKKAAAEVSTEAKSKFAFKSLFGRRKGHIADPDQSLVATAAADAAETSKDAAPAASENLPDADGTQDATRQPRGKEAISGKEEQNASDAEATK